MNRRIKRRFLACGTWAQTAFSWRPSGARSGLALSRSLSLTPRPQPTRMDSTIVDVWDEHSRGIIPFRSPDAGATTFQTFEPCRRYRVRRLIRRHQG